MIKFFRKAKKYSIKKLKNSIARIYVNDSQELSDSNLPAGTRVTVTYGNYSIKVIADVNGQNSIMETSRGGLLELRNKSTFESFNGVDSVQVTFTEDGVEIGLCYQDIQRLKRETTIINNLVSGQPIRTASLCSGTGLLALFIKNGLEKSGIKSNICLAIDSCEKAMSANINGNPIWQDASEDAIAIVNQLNNIDITKIRQADLVEIGLPCVPFSKLIKKHYRDIAHPQAGTIFCKLLAILNQINPAIFIIENVEGFLKSDAYSIIKRESVGYRFEEVILDGHSFGDIEGRSRACVVAVSEGLPSLNLQQLKPPAKVTLSPLSNYMETIPLQSELWRKMEHVKRKLDNPNLNFKNDLYTGSETKLGTLTAGYSAPRIGAPMIVHPENPELQRQFTAQEACNIRQLPASLEQAVMSFATGKNPLVKRSGSTSAVHRMLGNSVSKQAWIEAGSFIGSYLRDLKHLYDQFEANLKPLKVG